MMFTMLVSSICKLIISHIAIGHYMYKFIVNFVFHGQSVICKIFIALARTVWFALIGEQDTCEMDSYLRFTVASDDGKFDFQY